MLASNNQFRKESILWKRDGMSNNTEFPALMSGLCFEESRLPNEKA